MSEIDERRMDLVKRRRTVNDSGDVAGVVDATVAASSTSRTAAAGLESATVGLLARWVAAHSRYGNLKFEHRRHRSPALCAVLARGMSVLDALPCAFCSHA